MKKKTPSVNSLKKKVWTEFSKYIRLRDSDADGVCTCVTCGARKDWKEMHAGHAIQGRHNSILFDEKIVNAQCPVCNIWKGGEYTKYAIVLTERYGSEYLKEAYEVSKKNRQFTVSELEGLLTYYKSQWKQINEQQQASSNLSTTL